MSQTKEEKFGTNPQPKPGDKAGWGQRPNAPTVRTVESIDEYRIISKVFDKENRDLIMPVISADQYSAFDALTPKMVSFYTNRTEKWDAKNHKVVKLRSGEKGHLPTGTKEAMEFFDDFRAKYKTALTAENGYFGELLSRLLESVKSAEQKGTSGTEPKRGWSRFFLGGH